jgi:hypothetical protein
MHRVEDVIAGYSEMLKLQTPTVQVKNRSDNNTNNNKYIFTTVTIINEGGG